MAEDPQQPHVVQYTGKNLVTERTEQQLDACGADIAKDIRARVADLNELIKTANALGLVVELEQIETQALGSQPGLLLTVRVLTPL